MSTLSPLIDAWDEAHRELAIAFNGLGDEDLWKRPHPRLLSVGELAGHVAYAQAAWVFGDGTFKPDLATLPIQSPLIDPAFRYYLSSVKEPYQLPLTAGQVLAEVAHIHEATKAAIAGLEMDSPYPGQWRTWGNLVQYQVFHVAYHTGQMYSARHLLGHETEDN